MLLHAEKDGSMASTPLAISEADVTVSGNHDENDDGVVQHDDELRFSRYADIIGEGRFKTVYKGFDEQDGLDIAWAMISGIEQQLDDETLQQLLQDTQRNTRLRHKNIIRCFKCWAEGQEINLITELFSSGNLREYIQAHKQLGADALRKFSKQILEGIEYLHAHEPPIVHGDLRCDKIYVNGNEGTVKIGDLGLVTLLARRYCNSDPGSSYSSLASNQEVIKRSPAYDIHAFGLCMLEMYTQTAMSPEAAHDVPALLQRVRDDTARTILGLCFEPPESRPSASELIDRFFVSKWPKSTPSRAATPPLPEPSAPRPFARPASPAELSARLAAESAARHRSSNGLSADPAGATCHTSQHVGTDGGGGGEAGGSDTLPAPQVKQCQLKGEDYRFAVRQSTMPNTWPMVHLQLTMSSVEQAPEGGPVFSRTIEYEHNVEDDTPEGVGAELQEEYDLSETDRDIVCAIIKEGLSFVLGCERSPRAARAQ